MTDPRITFALVTHNFKPKDKLKHFRDCSSIEWSNIRVFWEGNGSAPSVNELKGALGSIGFSKMVCANPQDNGFFALDNVMFDMRINFNFVDSNIRDEKGNTIKDGGYLSLKKKVKEIMKQKGKK